MIQFRPRLIDCLAGYNRHFLRDDVLAGLTVGIVALPLAMAFAMASGVSPQAGIFTAVIGGLLAAVFGGTRLSVSGPTGAFIVIIYGIVLKYGLANLLICTMMAGVILLLMGLLRLGQVIRFFPMPLITGFTNGIAVLIFMTQLKDFFGLPVDKMPSGFFAVLGTLRRTLPHFDPTTLTVSGLTLALILLWPRRINKYLPAPFVALVAGTVAAVLLHLPIATIGSKFGGIPQGLPHFSMLTLDVDHLTELMAPALTIALLGAIESLLCAVVADTMTNDKHDANQELMAQGIANLVVPFFGGIPVTGALARTATSISNGGRTPVAAIVHALVLILILLLAAPLAAYIPLAVLAAILVSVSLRMGDWHLGKARLFPRRDTAILVVTFVLTVVFDLTVAVEFGLLMAAVFFIQGMARNTGIHLLRPEHAQWFERHSIAGKTVPPGCAAFRIEGALFFGATDTVEQLLREAPDARVIILQLHRLVLLDTSGLLALDGLNEKLREQDRVLILCGAGAEVMKLLVGSRLAADMGERNLQPDLAAALRRAEELLAAGE